MMQRFMIVGAGFGEYEEIECMLAWVGGGDAQKPTAVRGSADGSVDGFRESVDGFCFLVDGCQRVEGF